MSFALSAREVETRFQCEVVPGETQALSFEGVAPLQYAKKNHISFLTNDRYLNDAMTSSAGAILCSTLAAEGLRGKVKATLFICKEPYVVFARIAQLFHKPQHPFTGISEKAVVDVSASVHASATVFPFAFVGAGAFIGARTVVYSGVFVGAASVVGEDCILYPNAVIREGCELGSRCIVNPGAVIGGDGFGFAPSGMENVKIPQTGGVRVGDDVEIGSNASIDRGTMAHTQIDKQTKIDSLVQIGHNAHIGEACFLAGASAVAGSTTLGKRVTLAGQVGVAGHLNVGDEVTVLAQAGVTKNLEKGVYNGTPARPVQEYLRQLAVLSKLSRKNNETKK